MSDTTVLIRIGIHVMTDWLYGSGYVGEEVRDILTTDPAVVAAVEALICSVPSVVSIAWWRLARHFGWRT